MTSRTKSALLKTSALRKPNSSKSAAKAKTSKEPPKAQSRSPTKTGKLPEWNLSDLYGGIDAPEVARDLAKMDADCVAFETDYKGRLAEFTPRDDCGSWLSGAGQTH